jgi:hypothetical protein
LVNLIERSFGLFWMQRRFLTFRGSRYSPAPPTGRPGGRWPASIHPKRRRRNARCDKAAFARLRQAFVKTPDVIVGAAPFAGHPMLSDPRVPDAPAASGAVVSSSDVFMKISWRLTRDAFPNAADQSECPNFTAFDGQEPIGSVCQIGEGPDRGLWSWALTALQDESTSPHPKSGRATERAKAGRALLRAYAEMLAHPTPARLAKLRLAALRQV